MNLFILDENPTIAATLNCDTHVNKIILEATQCMCAAHWEHGFQLLKSAPNELQEGKYRGTCCHNNHITKWVRETTNNYQWTYNHAVELCKQHKYRYNKPLDHATLKIIHWLGQNTPNIPNKPQTQFRQAVAKECYHTNPVVAYWTYYAIHKSHLTTWKRVPTPPWHTTLTQKLTNQTTTSEILKHAEELYEKQKTTDKTDIQGIQKIDIPNGVYWNAHSQNFYSEETRQGLGTTFHFTWRDRSSEFPSCDGFGNRSNDQLKNH